MRISLIIVILACLAVNLGFAQTAKRIPIPVLKESKKIDQLLDIVLNPKNAKLKQSPDSHADVCYMIEMLKNGDKYFSLQIEKNSKEITNTLLNGMAIGTDNVGCFEYKKKLVIVWADKSFSDLFVRTSVKRTFDFAFEVQNPEPLSVEHFLDIWHYQYLNGHISEEGPPSVQ